VTWSPDDIPDLAGTTVVVTGPSPGGLGWFTSRELARRGARLVLAGRSQAKLDAAAGAIADEVPGVSLETVPLDLSELASVRDAGARIAELGPLDLLINNAGVMATPRRRTADGLDLQHATNHFGPFLLTGLLLPGLVASGHGRVVTLTSAMHRAPLRAPLRPPTRPPRFYEPWLVYGETKLTNLLFTYELDRRLRAAGLPVTALAAHPGIAHTHIVANGPRLGPFQALGDWGFGLLAQPTEHAVWPTLMAATADLPGGTFVGPSRRFGFAGPPHLARPRRLARSQTAQAALWKLSEQTTAIAYP
jgi:NAD(P)-dependent dehydrogenase (short-subunit alcohol dehydrogenase family)